MDIVKQLMALLSSENTWLPLNLHKTTGINPLAGAAAPILTIGYQLSEMAKPIDNIELLVTTLTKELKNFYLKANTLGYDAKQILAARYWLCCTLDELILNLPNPQKIQPPSLAAILGHSTASHAFFSILAEHQGVPHPSADLLEVAYLCLCLGYTGQYHDLPPTPIESIYQSLSNQTQALRKAALAAKKTKRHPIKFSRYIITAIVTITLITLVMTYSFYHTKLSPLSQAYQLAKHQHLIQTGPIHS